MKIDETSMKNPFKIDDKSFKINEQIIQNILLLSKWVQNRPFDLSRPQIDVIFYGESHGSNQQIYLYRNKFKNKEKHVQVDLSSALKKGSGVRAG